MSYIEFPVEVDAEVLAADALDTMAAKFPGWAPSDGHLEVHLIEVVARMNSETSGVAALVAPGIFQYIGRSVFGVPAIQAARATVPTTWTLLDTQGHTIPAGTYVNYRITADQQVPFRVQSDVVVAAGNDTTSTGEVILEAVYPGTAANGLPAGEFYLIDALAWVETITSGATTAGGVDAETDAAYLNRLSTRLQALSPAPILPVDFALLAGDVPGVGRATAIDNYDPTDDSYDNERMVSVAVAAADGTALDGDTKDEVQGHLDELREVNFVVHVIDPEYTEVSVTAAVKKFATFDSSDVEAACEAALASYLSPANWDWSGVVRRNELIALLSNVAGVDYVISVTTPSTDVNLSGPASLPTAGTMAVTVS